MRKPAQPFTTSLRAVAMTAALAMPVGLAHAAEDVSEDQIVRALAPKKPLTRSLSAAPADPAATAAETKLIDTVRNRTTRSLSSAEREQIAEIVKDKPKIDLEITFDYNSDDISRKSEPAVRALGKALSNPDLKGSTFMVAGHTDAAGPDSYNQDLSERRADAIKRALVDRYGLTANELVTVGYGETKLKDTVHPMAAVNRRVQVVNMQSKTAAK